MLSHNRFIDYLVLIFVDKKKAQIYTFPNRVDEHDVIKLIIDFQYKKSTFKDEYSYLYRNGKTNGKKLQNYKLIHE